IVYPPAKAARRNSFQNHCLRFRNICFEGQDKHLEDRDGGDDDPSREDATIKGRRLETGKEVGIERSTEKGNDDTEEMDLLGSLRIFFEKRIAAIKGYGGRVGDEFIKGYRGRDLLGSLRIFFEKRIAAIKGYRGRVGDEFIKGYRGRAPHSPEYVPRDHVPVFVPEFEHPKDLVPAEDEAPASLLAPGFLSPHVCTKESSEFCTRHHDAKKDRAAMRAEIEVLRSERLAYEQEGIQTREAFARSEAYYRALEARVAVLETHACRLKGQIMARTRRGQTPPPTNPNNPNNMTPEAVQTMINQALLRNSGGEDESHRHYARDCRSTDNTNATNNRGGNGPNLRGNGCFECGNPGHFKRDYPKLNNKNRGNGNAQGWVYVVDLMPVKLGSFDAIIGMYWLRRHHTVIVCDEKLVRVPFGNETLVFRRAESYIGRESRLTVISCSNGVKNGV
nr:reverse transcriptase domain-containing protein [Tanacetum cinerariifolium]